MDYHIRKVLKIYRERRDLFCMLLKGELSDFFEFNTPKGGMAVWTKLNLNYSWYTIFKIARRHKLEIGIGSNMILLNQDIIIFGLVLQLTAAKKFMN
jgi:DNA-binding transcriptional MocR family regulator